MTSGAKDWLKMVPKDRRGNLRWRQFILAWAKKSKARQALIRRMCAEDILFYFNSFVFTYDPRLRCKAVPFITYPFQDEAILEIQGAIRSGESLLMQKARDMGASWISLGVMDYQSQFVKGSKFLMMSRGEKLVDEAGDPDSLFWKIDFIHQYLPSWLKPNVNRRKMGIQYRDNGSSVTGCATTGAAGVGGRATAVFIDEFSRFDPKEAKLVMAGIADTSPCRIWNFTPFGQAHPSYDLVKQAERGDLKTVRMYWTDHPEKAKGHYTYDAKKDELTIIDKSYEFPADYEFQKDGKFFNHSPAFDRERKNRGDDRVMMEMWEINYEGASSLFFDAGTVRDLALEFARPPIVEGDLNYDLTSGVPREFIRVKGGQIKLWINLDARGRAPVEVYGGGIDISTGQGSSNSVIAIANIVTGEKILEYATASMLPTEFAVKCVAICWWLAPRRDLKMCWECPGPGQTFGKKIMELGYSPVFWRKNEMSISGGQTDTPGWYATAANKRMLLEQYRESLQTRNYINRSEPAYRELMEWEITPTGIQHFGNRRKSYDPTGAAMNHGDRTIADALTDKMRRERGGGNPAEARIIRPGTVAYLMQEEARQTQAGEELYPHWNRSWQSPI